MSAGRDCFELPDLALERTTTGELICGVVSTGSSLTIEVSIMYIGDLDPASVAALDEVTVLNC